MMRFNLSGRYKEKVFCIGLNKTGTTSIEKALEDLEYKMGDQKEAELLLRNYLARDFGSIIKHCKTADAFQDAPFSYKYTYVALDQVFSNAKFILTLRDSEEQWYNSLVSFHSKLFANNERTPTWEDLKVAQYRFPGYIKEVMHRVLGMDLDKNPYEKDTLIEYYRSHNNAVKNYFKYKDNLLVLNLTEKDSYVKLCEFLGKKPIYDDFPWENKTSEMQ